MVKKILGVILLILGFIILITPFTPGALVILFLGLELLGLRLVFEGWLKRRLRNKIIDDQSLGSE